MASANAETRRHTDAAEEGLASRSLGDVEEADERLVADLVEHEPNRAAPAGEALEGRDDGREDGPNGD